LTADERWEHFVAAESRQQWNRKVDCPKYWSWQQTSSELLACDCLLHRPCASAAQALGHGEPERADLRTKAYPGSSVETTRCIHEFTNHGFRRRGRKEFPEGFT
jgi:hypothetical protein